MLQIAEMPRYEVYKDSGVEWLGRIPEGWSIRRLKYLFKEINERSDSGSESLLSVSQYTGVTPKADNISDSDLLTNAESLDRYKLVKENDLVSNIMLAWNGSLAFSSYSGIVSPAYSVYRLSKKCNQRFFHYLLRTDIYKTEYKRKSRGVIESRLRLYTNDFYNVFGLIPTLVEQNLIANFLDQKTAQIDAAIAIKEQQIELLKERKQIIIQQAVTKGLDPTVPMKNSGVDWIGEIPAHWGVRKIKYISSLIQTGPFGTELHAHDYITAGIPLINPKHMIDGVIAPEEGCSIDTTTAVRLSKYILKKDDLIMARRGELGRCAVVTSKEDGWICGTGSIVLRFSQNVKSEYLYRLISGQGIKKILSLNSVGSTMDNLNSSVLGSIRLPLPPFCEQELILGMIKNKALEVNQVISVQKKQIEKLKEYKTTLIDSAVTGKIKITADMLAA